MKNTKLRFWGLLLLLAALGLTGCDEDLPAVTVDLARHDLMVREVAQTATDTTEAACTAALEKVVGRGSDLYLLAYQLFGADSAALAQELQRQPKLYDFLAADICLFGRDTTVNRLIDAVGKVYPANMDLAARFQAPWARLKAAFPEQPLPRVRFGFFVPQGPVPSWDQLLQLLRPNYVAASNTVFVYWEYVTSPEFPFLHPETPQYVRRTLNPAHLLPMCTAALASHYRPDLPPFQQPLFIDYLVADGIRLAFQAELLPDTPDTLLLGYTGPQLAWCKANEAALFETFRPLLFNRNLQDFGDYLAPGPFTKALGPESPGNVGQFIGWRIVQAYRESTAASLAELVATKDLGGLFRKSGYAPKPS